MLNIDLPKNFRIAANADLGRRTARCPLSALLRRSRTKRWSQVGPLGATRCIGALYVALDVDRAQCICAW